MTILAALAPAMSAVSAGVTAVGGIMSGMAQAQAGEYQAAVANNNAILARLNAARAVDAGNEQAQAQDLKNRAVMGSQIAGQGASGLTLGTGSLADVNESTGKLARYDTLQVVDAAQRQKVDYLNEANSDEAQAEMARATGQNNAIGSYLGAFGSLVSGASSVATKWASLKNAGITAWNPFS